MKTRASLEKEQHTRIASLKERGMALHNGNYGEVI